MRSHDRVFPAYLVAALAIFAAPAVAWGQACATCYEDYGGTLWCAQHGNPNIWGVCPDMGELCGGGCLQSSYPHPVRVGEFASLDLTTPDDIWKLIEVEGDTNVRLLPEQRELALLDCGGQIVLTRPILDRVATKIAEKRAIMKPAAHSSTSSGAGDR